MESAVAGSDPGVSGTPAIRGGRIAVVCTS